MLGKKIIYFRLFWSIFRIKFFVLVLLGKNIIVGQDSDFEEVVIERHSNGMKKVVIVFDSKGIDQNLLSRHRYYDNGVKEFLFFNK